MSETGPGWARGGQSKARFASLLAWMSDRESAGLVLVYRVTACNWPVCKQPGAWHSTCGRAPGSHVGSTAQLRHQGEELGSPQPCHRPPLVRSLARALRQKEASSRVHVMSVSLYEETLL